MRGRVKTECYYSFYFCKGEHSRDEEQKEIGARISTKVNRAT